MEMPAVARIAPFRNFVTRDSGHGRAEWRQVARTPGIPHFRIGSIFKIAIAALIRNLEGKVRDRTLRTTLQLRIALGAGSASEIIRRRS